MKRLLFAGLMLALLSFAFIHKNERTITGIVKDEKGTPIPFATITVKGKHQSVAANASGSFKIKIDDKVQTLEVSAIGFQTEEIQLTDAANYNVVLKKSSTALQDATVVTGYEVQRKAKSVGYKLQGSVAGVSVESYDKNYKFSPPQIVKDEEEHTNDSWRYNGDFNTEGYDHIVENPFLKTNDNPLSTFSIDVDAASYANVRRFINEGELPPPGAVRIEELINYFSYNYPQPQNDDPFSINTEFQIVRGMQIIKWF